MEIIIHDDHIDEYIFMDQQPEQPNEIPNEPINDLVDD